MSERNLVKHQAMELLSLHFNFGGSDIEKIEGYVRGFGGKLHQYFHICKEHPLVKEVQVIKEISVIKEVDVPAPPTVDDWFYHTGRILHHIKILILKTLYKIHIRFNGIHKKIKRNS